MLSGRSFVPSSSMRVVPPVSVSVATALFSSLLTREDPDLRPNIGAITVEDFGHARTYRVEVLDALAHEDDDHLPSRVVVAEPDAGHAGKAAKLRLVAAQRLGCRDLGHGSTPRAGSGSLGALKRCRQFPAEIASRSKQIRSHLTAPPLSCEASLQLAV